MHAFFFILIFFYDLEFVYINIYINLKELITYLDIIKRIKIKYILKYFI
jgi:hypothetical protein